MQGRGWHGVSSLVARVLLVVVVGLPTTLLSWWWWWACCPHCCHLDGGGDGHTGPTAVVVMEVVGRWCPLSQLLLLWWWWWWWCVVWWGALEFQTQMIFDHACYFNYGTLHRAPKSWNYSCALARYTVMSWLFSVVRYNCLVVLTWKCIENSQNQLLTAL